MKAGEVGCRTASNEREGCSERGQAQIDRERRGRTSDAEAASEGEGRARRLKRQLGRATSAQELGREAELKRQISSENRNQTMVEETETPRAPRDLVGSGKGGEVMGGRWRAWIGNRAFSAG